MPMERSRFEGTSPQLSLRPADRLPVVVTRTAEVALLVDPLPRVVRQAPASPANPASQATTASAATRSHRLGEGARVPLVWVPLMWMLGAAEACLVVGGLLLLLSTAFLHGTGPARGRAELGIGLIFGGAALSVPAAVLIAERPVPAATTPRGRHRRR